MATFQCRKCKAIRDFKDAGGRLTVAYDATIHDPFQATCLRCFTPGAFAPYTGPMTGAVLAREDAAVDELVLRRDSMVAQLEAVQRTKEIQQQEYVNGGTDGHTHVVVRNIQLCTDAIVSLSGEVGALEREIERASRERTRIHEGAAEVHNASIGVQAASKKNKLYIGSRQHVSQHARTPQKRKRILDANIWSWGLNLAWVEGGVKAKAQFKLKLNDENPFHTIPGPVLDKLQKDPKMQPEAFLKMCRDEGAGSLLWYDLNGENRPTWTALEIAALLRAGYGFKFLARGGKHKGETKIVLEP